MNATPATPSAGATDPRGSDAYDVFISYATDDWEQARDAGAALERAGLRVYLDVPRDPEQSPLEVLVDRLARGVKAPFQRSATTVDRRSDAEVLTQFRTWLDHSRCLLVLWSRSHRGSRWAFSEIDIFEREHPDRPIFVVRVDRTPWAPPTTQWIAIVDAGALTRARLESDARNLHVESVGVMPQLFDVVLRPSRWTTAVQQRRWGTSGVEVLALASETPSDAHNAARATQRAGVLRSAAAATLLGAATALVLALGGLIAAARLPGTSEASRHVMFTTTTVVTFALLLSVQAELPALVATVPPAAGIALIVQLLWSWSTAANAGAGPGAGAVLGAIGGGVLIHSWPRRGDDDGPSASRSRVTASVVMTLAALAAFVIVFVPQQPANGQLHSLALVSAVAAALLLPALALWREVSNTGRAREVLIKGSASSALVFAIIIASAWLFDHSVLCLDQQTLTGGAVAGLVAGLCAGAIALAPGALFGDCVDRHLRVVASVVAVSLSLIVLYPLLLLIGGQRDFMRDLWNASGAYAIGFIASAAAAAASIRVCRMLTGD